MYRNESFKKFIVMKPVSNVIIFTHLNKVFEASTRRTILDLSILLRPIFSLISTLATPAA